MTNTNQAFIEAYERTASLQASQGALPNTTQPGSDPTPKGPHFHTKQRPVGESAQPRRPLSDFLSQRIAAAGAETGLSSEANLQANLQSNRAASALDTDSVPIESTFEVNSFHWPTAAVELAKSARSSMVGVIDQVIASSTNVLALSSARQKVGLTTTTLAFALTAIESGMQVAMIDLCLGSSNIVRSGLPKAESLSQSLGLSKMRSLRETSTLGMSLGEAVVTSQNNRASVISAGSNLDPTIASAAISRISAANDFVLIDAGIAGAPERSLSEWIAPMQGAALLVDLADGSRYDAARIAAANQLNKLSTRFLGVIENLV